MLSNGFSNGVSLYSLPKLTFYPNTLEFRWQRHLLGVTSAGNWYVGFAHPTAPVVLLRHNSFWWNWIAGISLQTATGKRLTLWFLRTDESHAWRRLRVRFRHI